MYCGVVYGVALRCYVHGCAEFRCIVMNYVWMLYCVVAMLCFLCCVVSLCCVMVLWCIAVVVRCGDGLWCIVALQYIVVLYWITLPTTNTTIAMWATNRKRVLLRGRLASAIQYKAEYDSWDTTTCSIDTQ